MLPTKRFDRSTPPPIAIPFQPPRLCYFISRSNSNIVPLVPADELPYSVRLTGVPRAMKMEHTCGMNHVGTHPFTGQYFKLEADATSTQRIIDRTSGSKQRPTEPSAILHRSEQVRLETTNPPKTEQATSYQPPVSATAISWRKPDDAASARSQVIIDNIVASESRSPARVSPTALKVSRTSTSSPSNMSELGDKVYCTHWIRHGECDYTQQGCRYKHEMPDRNVLASIGFRTVPRWWQKKVAVQLGQSAIPTVGPAMKPAEWLRMRRASQDSQSDDESDIESEIEAGDDKESGIAAVPEKTSVSQHATTTSSSTTKDIEESLTPSYEKIADMFEHFVATTKPVDLSKQFIPDGDLIDLGSTTTISCNGSVTTLDSSECQKQLSTSPPVPFPSKSERKQSSPPRKVFVPAGESTEFHVAEARKHAQTQQGKLESSITMDRSNAQDSSTKQQQQQLPVKPVVILKRPDVKSGLKASMHAPQAAREPSLRSNHPPAATKPRSMSHKAENKVPSPKSSKPLSGSQAHSRTTEAAKSAAPKVGAVDVRDKSPKATRAQIKHNPPSVCRPRRPAVSLPKTADTKSSAWGTKVKEAKK
jgi:hypothetical protein